MAGLHRARCRRSVAAARAAAVYAAHHPRDCRPRCIGGAAAESGGRHAGRLGSGRQRASSIIAARSRTRRCITPLVVSALTLRPACMAPPITRPARTSIARCDLCARRGSPACSAPAFTFTMSASRPGGFSWQNLFYGAPLGAPMAILLSGLLGFCSERVRDSEPGTSAANLRAAGGPGDGGADRRRSARHAAEAGLLHFRGAFHNPFMLLPVTLPPVGGGAAGDAPLARRARDRWFTRGWLRLTALLGFAGVGFHAYGVAAQHGRLAQLDARTC